MKRNKRLLLKIISVLLALILWQALAMIINKSLILPSPVSTAVKIGEIVCRTGFLRIMSTSLTRILFGFLIGTCAGCIFAALAGKYQTAEILLRPYITVAKSVPVVSFIVLALIWFSAKNISIFISCLVTLPVVYTNLLNGIHALDKDMEEMADVFRIPKAKKTVYVHLPQLRPYIISACTLAIGLSVKAGIAAELIGLPGKSLGEALYEAKIYFMTSELFAWTILIIIAGVILEKLILLLLKFIFGRIEKA